jgi:ATP-dependent RNA helicase SUPV3L1/SUV3
MIKESIAQLLAQTLPDDLTKQPFVVSNDGHIGWRDANNPSAEALTLALLHKGDDIYNPKLQLLHTDILTPDQTEALLPRLQNWWDAHKQAQLLPLLNLQYTEAVTQNVATILQQLYAAFGMMPRTQVQELIKSLEATDRQVLRKRGVQLGAFFVFAREALKPACLNLKAVLYRVFYGLAEAGTKLPPFGNVTMQAPENAPADFYKAVGYPLFGQTMLRIDMAERLNTAVYDGAVEGKYKFTPSISSTVGVGVEVAKTMLRELGFKEEIVTEQVTKTVAAIEPGAEPTEVTEEIQVYYYHLKRRAPKILAEKNVEKRVFKKPDAQKFSKQSDKKKVAHKFGQKFEERSKPAEKPQAPKGHQAFAELLALKERMGQ